MVSGDKVVLFSVLILGILFDLFLLGCIYSVDSLVTSAFLAVFLGLIVLFSPYLSVHQGFKWSYSCSRVWT